MAGRLIWFGLVDIQTQSSRRDGAIGPSRFLGGGWSWHNSSDTASSERHVTRVGGNHATARSSNYGVFSTRLLGVRRWRR